MNSRERVLTALDRREPDRIPIDIGGTGLSSAKPEMQQMVADVLGLAGKPETELTGFDERIQKHFGCDLREIKPAARRKWGFKNMMHAPLRNASIEDIDSHPWPEPTDEMVAGLREKAQYLHERTEHCICADQIGQGIFELGCWLRGYDQILLDIMMNHEFIHAFNRKVVAVNRALDDLYFSEIGEYVDIVVLGDDLAMQTGPYMALDTFRELYKPYFAEYIAGIKKHCPHAKILHHCCGSSYALLDDLAEIGVDISNPVQTTATDMDPENLARKKGIVSFHGGGDLQHVLPYATTDEVEAFVKNLITHLAPNGGYILAACHTLPEDVKPENIVAMFEAGLKWGTYPIRL